MTLSALALLPFGVPLLQLCAAAAGGTKRRWDWALVLNGSALLIALISATLYFSPNSALLAVGTSLSANAASYLIAVLVSFLGLIVAQYSRNYLAGETRESRYAVMLHITLAAVAIVVLTDNLLVLLGGWVAISLALNELLLFYPERPRAALAAHKKYLFARIAELAIFAAALLLFTGHGTWQISEIAAAFPERSLTTSDHLAAVLLAAAALIKCAQLPMHGWLIQVVEAPTPVSALLHAGIINLGGYLLIAFAPLISAAAVAQGLLLLVAGLTTVLAALIMTTRVTIKVKLAWSTAAQMGLMLIECALGLYELALLHLLAHACYKAYFFLSAGMTVERYLLRQVTPAATVSLGTWLLAAAVAIPVTVIAAQLLAPQGPVSPWLLVAAFLTVFFAERSSTVVKAPFAVAGALGLVLLVALLAQKLLLGALQGSEATALGWIADLWVVLLIGVLFLGSRLMKGAPTQPLTQKLSTWLYAGLYLDEWVTRTTLRLWPLRLPIRLQQKQLGRFAEDGEQS